MIEHRFEIELRDGRRRDALLLHDVGWGESSPLAGYECDPAASRAAAEEAARGDWPAAVRTEIPVNALVTDDRFSAADFTGVRCIKVKVGDAGDVDRVARLRDLVGPQIAIRVDANGRWDEATAIARIASLERYDLEYVEEPVHGLDAIARVRRAVGVPIAIDESLRSLDDARAVSKRAIADVIVLKVQPCGGVREAMRWAEAAGVPAVVTSMLETSIGIRAGVALAAALPALPYACGLGTAGMLVHDVTDAPLLAVDGVLAVRDVDVRLSD